MSSPGSGHQLRDALLMVRTLLTPVSGPAEPDETERAFALFALYLVQRRDPVRGAPADGDDEDVEPSWIHRRTERFEVLDDRRVRRRVALDFKLPPQVYDQLVDARVLPHVPLTLLTKGKLHNFDVRDEEGRSLSAVRRSESSELAATGLAQWLPEDKDDKGVVRTYEAIRTRTPDPDTAATLREMARRKPDPKFQRPAEFDSMAPFMRRVFGPLVVDLVESYLLLVPYEATAPGRRIIKLSWEEDLLPTTRNWDWAVSELLRRMGWRHVEIRLALPGLLDARSHHCEFQAPPDMEISRAQLWVGGRCADGEGGGIASAHLHDSGDGGTRPARRRKLRQEVAFGVPVGLALAVTAAAWLVLGLVGLVVALPLVVLATWWPAQRERPVPERAHALVYLRVKRSGFLRAALVTAWLTTALLVAALLRLDDILREVEASATVLALVPGLLAAYLVRPSEHALATNQLIGVRLFLMLSGASAIAGGALLLGHLDPETTELGWTFLICVSAASAIGITLSNVLPLHGRARPRSKPSAGVVRQPEGVQSSFNEGAHARAEAQPDPAPDRPPDPWGGEA